MGKNRHQKVRLAQIARESIRLSDPGTRLREIREILDKKWLRGAINLGCSIRTYCDKGFLRDNKHSEEMPSFLRRQMLYAFGKLSEYQAGNSFDFDKDALILLEMEVLVNNSSEERIVAAHFVLASEVEV